MTTSARTILLNASLILNLILVGGIVRLTQEMRSAVYDATAQAAEDSAALQRRILSQLETKDAKKIEALKASLRLGIDAQQRVSYKVRTGIVK